MFRMRKRNNLGILAHVEHDVDARSCNALCIHLPRQLDDEFRLTALFSLFMLYDTAKVVKEASVPPGQGPQLVRRYAFWNPLRSLMKN